VAPDEDLLGVLYKEVVPHFMAKTWTEHIKDESEIQKYDLSNVICPTSVKLV